MTADQMRAVLDSRLCWCGRAKLTGQKLCQKCYSKVDAGIRIDLLAKPGRGLEEVYEIVVAALKRSHVRPKHAVPPRPARIIPILWGGK